MACLFLCSFSIFVFLLTCLFTYLFTGMNELESIQQTTAAISEGVNTVFPKMANHFAATHRQIADLQKSISEMQRSLAIFTTLTTAAATSAAADDWPSSRDRDAVSMATSRNSTSGFTDGTRNRRSPSPLSENKNTSPLQQRPQSGNANMSGASEAELVASELPRRIKSIALSTGRATVCGGTTTHQLHRQNATTVGFPAAVITDENGADVTALDAGNGNSPAVWQLTSSKSMTSCPVLTAPLSAASKHGNGGSENCDTLFTFSV